MKQRNNMTAVLGFLGKIFKKENREMILIVALALMAFLWIRGCNREKNAEAEAKRQEAINAQNQRALQDSLRYVKNKAGEIEAIKSSFVSKLEDLEKLNKDLYLESKKEIGNLKALIKGSIGINTGNVVMSNELKHYPDGVTHGLLFEKTKIDSGLVWSIKGESKFKLENNTIFPGQTEIFNNQIKLKLVLGFKENKDNYEVFARSASPYVTFDDLSGVMLIPKKADPLLTPPVKNKKFGLGIHVGYGVGFFNKQVMLTPYVGVGLQYNLIKF